MDSTTLIQVSKRLRDRKQKAASLKEDAHRVGRGLGVPPYLADYFIEAIVAGIEAAIQVVDDMILEVTND